VDSIKEKEVQGSRSVSMFLLTSETINSHAIDTSEAWKYSHKKELRYSHR
jgi:hypothetical protein